MKILMLGCKEYPYGISSGHEKFAGGGTAKYVINLIEGLLKAGHEIVLITRLFPGQKKYEKNGKLEIYRVKFFNNKFLRLMSFNINSFLRARSMKDIDIIHAHNPFAIVSGYYLSKRLHKPVIGTPHGTVTNQWKGLVSKFFHNIEKNIYIKCNKIVFFSEFDKKKFEELTHIKYNNGIIIPSGIETNHPHQFRDSKILRILFVGRLVPVKRIDNLIVAISLMSEKERAHICLDIVGDGYEQDKLKQLVKEKNLQGKIRFFGFQKETERFYKQANIFILPSDSEGFPIALLEAMSYGLPCITNDFKLPIDDNALVVMSDNKPETISKNILRVASNKSLRKKMSIRAYNEIKNVFDFKKVTLDHIRLYERVKRGN